MRSTHSCGFALYPTTSPRQTKCVHLCLRASASTASSASRLAWISLKIAKRIDRNALRCTIGNSLILRDSEFVFEEFQARDQSRQPFLFTLVVELTQAVICFALPSFAVGEFVGGKAPVETLRSRQDCCLGEKRRRVLVVFVFLFINSGKRFVELRAVGVIFYSALKKIFSKRKILALRFDAQRKAWLGAIVHRGNARVPSHVPCRHVPK